MAQQRAVEPLMNELKGLISFDSHTDKKLSLLQLIQTLSDLPWLLFNNHIWLVGITWLDEPCYGQVVIQAFTSSSES
jgi:hypothetical protein